MIFPLTALTATINDLGITAPSYNDVLTSLKTSAAIIYGEDVYLEADSQDGQMLAIFAKAIHDCNQMAIAVYNAFSPATAQGAGLSNVVKINHIRRNIATSSQVNVTVTGVAGTTITGGLVGDDAGNRWRLPEPVIIPSAGFILVTATAENVGAINAAPTTVNRILTPTAGWQSVSNAAVAVVGKPIETDAALRNRQIISPAINANTTLLGLTASLLALPGVTYGVVYENDTGVVNADGLPAHSIAAVVQGGVAAAIAAVIYAKKSPGVATYGTTTVPIIDVSGVSRSINFFAPTEKAIKVAISLQAGTNYTSSVASEIKVKVAEFINGLTVGEDLVVNRLYVPALLSSAMDSETYKITVLQAALVAAALGTADVVMAFNEKATCVVADITITVV